MLCPYCHKDNNTVYTSSPPWYHDKITIKRYRKCKCCGASFATIEKYAVNYEAKKARSG